MIRAPGAYDPVAHPDAASGRRNLVLDRMAELRGDRSRRRREGAGQAAADRERRRGVQAEGRAVLRLLHPEPDPGQRRRAVRRVRTAADPARAHAVPGRAEHLRRSTPRGRTYAQEAVDDEPGDRPGPEQPRRLAGLGPRDRRRDQGDALGQELQPRPVRPRLARDATGGVGVQPFTLVAAFEQGFPQGRSTRRSRRCATSPGGSARAGA